MAVMIKLSSSDDLVFEVPSDVAKMSATIKNLLADLGMAEDNEEEAKNRAPIPLSNVKGEVMTKIIEWCTEHRGEAASETSLDDCRTDDISEWDQEFLNLAQTELFEIIMAANYLDIKGLLEVGCKTVANLIKDKTTAEIRDTFNIANNFTPDEEDQMEENGFYEY